MKPVVFDLDDFCFGTDHPHATVSRDVIDKLLWYKELVPSLKVSLFTVPALSCRDALQTLLKDRRFKFIELIPHGYTHATSRECEQWTYAQMMALIRKLHNEGWPFVAGFKAPGWQISDGAFAALRDAGCWIADQEYNRDRRPEGIGYYELGQHGKVDSLHGHVGHLGGHNDNALECIEEKLLALEGREFKFVSEVVEPWHGRRQKPPLTS